MIKYLAVHVFSLSLIAGETRSLFASFGTAGLPLVKSPALQVQSIPGTVSVDIKIDEDGLVSQMYAINGPEPLARLVSEHLKELRFAKVAGLPRRLVMHVYFSTANQPPPPPPPPWGSKLDGISYSGLTPAEQRRIERSLPLHTGDVLTSESLRRAEQAVRKVVPDAQFVLSLPNGKPEFRIGRR